MNAVLPTRYDCQHKLTLLSLIRFLGAVFAKRGLVAFYSTALLFSLILNFLCGVYSSWSAVHRRQGIVNECVQQTQNNNTGTVANDENKLTSDACSAASKAGVVIAIALFVIIWLIELCKRTVSSGDQHRSH